ILNGNHKAATNAAALGSLGPRDWEYGAIRTGLLYLAGLKAKEDSFADEQWKQLGKALLKGDHEARRLADVVTGKQPLDPKFITELVVRPEVKRVILTALARKFPMHAKDLILVAKKLDFEHDSTSLCLRYLTEQ